MERFLVVLLSLLIPMHYLGRGLFYIDLVLIILISLYLLFKNKIKVLELVDKFMMGVFSFYLIALIINFFNPTQEYSNNIRLLYSLPIVLLIFNYIFVYSKLSELNFILFQKVLFFSTSLICSVLFLSYLIDINIIFSIKNLQLINHYDHSLFHARQNYFAILIPFFLHYYFRNKNLLNLFTLILIYLGTFSSYGRTAILTITIGTLIYFIIDRIENKKSKFNTFIIVLLSILLPSIILILISGDRVYDLNSLTSLRYNGWILNIDLIMKDNTFLGYGTNGSLQLYNSGLLSFKHPHNIYLEALFSLGLIGFIMLCFLTCMYFICILKSKSIYSKNLAISTFFAIFINVQAIGGIWGYAFVIIVLSILYLSSRDIKKVNSEESF